MTESNHRIHLIEAEEAPDSIKPLYERADSAMVDGQIPKPTLFGNQVRALAHNPALLKSLIGVYETFSETQSIERKLAELGILIVSKVNACTYCIQHHTPLAHDSGLSTEQLQIIEEGTWQEHRDLWADDEWVVIQYAEQMTREPYKILYSLFVDLHKHFSDRQIVDMTMRFALCSAWNKFNDALGLDTESAFQHAFSEIMG
ncbi:MAG: carboxymuconolactone decarboxylase family protein [Anaerolineae bacterium]|nr:carboxymuconolactone decarboxylase family protein [Anaerolineae bacterium]MDQ7035685.1 carboxymuconolactone decarboxylase family protein [Anaerolineae bacterium]